MSIGKFRFISISKSTEVGTYGHIHTREVCMFERTSMATILVCVFLLVVVKARLEMKDKPRGESKPVARTCLISRV